MNHINCSLDFASKQDLRKQSKKTLRIHFPWRRALRRIYKVIYVSVLILALQVPSSLAFFWDSEISSGNVFAAGELDLGFESKQSSFDPTGLLKGQSATFSAKLINISGLPFKYKLGIGSLDPNNELCNNLSLKVWHYRYKATGVLEKIPKYSGSLTDFMLNGDSSDPLMRISDDQIYFPNSDYKANEHWYWYEVSLPVNADPDLGNQSCDFRFTAEAAQRDLDWQIGFWDSESLTTRVSTSSWAKVSGLKWNDLNKNGFKDGTESAISNWKIFAGKQFDQFVVNSDGTVAESKILEDGKEYIVRASGFIQNGTDLRSDAKYASKSPYGDWTDSVVGYEGNGEQFLDLQIDGVTPDWGEYQPDHEYWASLTGNGNKVVFDINNQVIPNNSGSLQVTIFEVAITDTTDENGLYEIDLSNLSGEFIVGEIQQSGWMQTYPTKGFYTFATAAIYENKNFGNVAIAPTPDIVKVVINEVYYDATESSSENPYEWVELYNAGSKAVSLQNWSLTDNAGSDSFGDYTLAASAYAVVVTNNAATTLLTQIANNNPNATVITLDNATIGEGLNNTGDQLTLKDQNNQTVDFVAWEKGYEDTYPTWTISAAEGQSLARKTPGFDVANNQSDWLVLGKPNPGTNPHSHIQVNLKQEGNNLLLSFSNAYGFDLVKYLVTYSHLYNGLFVDDAIEGQKSKLKDQNLLILNPFYLGTCSSLGEVCVPHLGIKDLQITFEYFDGSNTLGTSQIDYTWK